MQATKTITYAVEHVCEPVFSPHNLALAQSVGDAPSVIVVDDVLWPWHGLQIEHYSRAHLQSAHIIRLAGSESTKSLECVADLCATAFDAGLPRNGVFIGVGGGAILDTVGFAASIYRRGVSYIRVPTTLVGMIDVGVGVKQAVNFHHKKNSLGAFYAPRCTLNDVHFLATLPRRELSQGVAEALKMGLVCDAELFALIEEHGPLLVANGFRSPERVVTEILMRAETSMMGELAANLFETDLRRLVDFGHTFSPIIETASEYSVPHGDAVALDMLLSSAIAAGRELCDPELVGRLRRLFGQLGLLTSHPAMSPLLMERALSDARAHRSGALNLVVPVQVGAAQFLQDVTYDEIVDSLDRITHYS